MKGHLITAILVITMMSLASVSTVISFEPRYARGDIVQENHPFGDRIVIIGYNETDDKYTVASVRRVPISWCYDGTSSIEDRETIEESYPKLVEHVSSLTEIRDLGIVIDTMLVLSLKR